MERHYRPDIDLSGNYYPTIRFSYLQDARAPGKAARQLAVLSTQPHGVSSRKNGGSAGWRRHCIVSRRHGRDASGALFALVSCPTAPAVRFASCR